MAQIAERQKGKANLVRTRIAIFLLDRAAIPPGRPERLNKQPCANCDGHHTFAVSYAFDLLELNGSDLRREPIEVRKALASILRKSRPGVRLNEHLEHDCGLTVFQHACKMGPEGIVSKRLGSRYRSGRSSDWLKFKKAVKREADEDWNR